MKKTIKTNTLRSSITVVAMTLLLQGCASTVVKQVSQSDRNTAGSFDGTWQAQVVKTAGIQYGPGNWQFSCKDMRGRSLGKFTVNQGIAQMGNNNGAIAYVNNAGKFRFEIPMSEVAAAAGTSDSTISNGKMTYIIYGSLKNQKGTMTFGIAQFSNNGCSSKVQFSKI